MVKSDRVLRIAERIREELSEILLLESLDPRLKGISVTGVTVDRELDFANIFVSAVEGSERSTEILEGLNHAQGFLRSELARRIDLRSFPRLRFHWDPTFEQAESIEHLFNVIAEEEQAKAKQAGKSSPRTKKPDAKVDDVVDE